jgi:hypothetical protein
MGSWDSNIGIRKESGGPFAVRESVGLIGVQCSCVEALYGVLIAV